MPQDIPAEASETLAYTPPSLADIDGAPSFILRAITPRDERHLRRLNREEGVSRYSDEAVRAEILRGLAKEWTPEQLAEHKPVLEAYWSALDDFISQRKDNPDLAWSYDPEIEEAITSLVERITDAHAPLRRMIADNADAAEMTPKLMMAVTIKSWAGIDVRRDLDRGYLTVTCAEALQRALAKLAKEQFGEQSEDLPGNELFVACVRRFRLDGDEEKNSESPSPSETTQAPTATGTESNGGTSPASASSKKTPASA